MVGTAFYNIFIPEKKFEYVVMPMFAFGTSNLAGGGKLTYHSYPANSFIQKITWSAGVQSYSYATDQYEPLDQSFHYSSTLQFSKLDSRIAFLFRQKNPVGKIRSTILFRNVVINRDMPYFFSYRPSTFENQFYELSYNRENSNKLFPSDFNLSLRASNVLVKASLERKYKITYDDISKGLDIRIFGGYNLYRSTYTKGIDYHLQLSGNSTALDDRITKVFLNEYMFDEVFLGRTEYKGILSRQFIANDGGFKVPTFLFREADRWMVAVNLKTSVPGILPLKLFADIGTFDHAADLTGGSAISFDAGIELDVIKDIFTIYFPIAYSDDIKFVVDTEELNFGDLIRFELHLNKLNPITLIKQLDF